MQQLKVRTEKRNPNRKLQAFFCSSLSLVANFMLKRLFIVLRKNTEKRIGQDFLLFPLYRITKTAQSVEITKSMWIMVNFLAFSAVFWPESAHLSPLKEPWNLLRYLFLHVPIKCSLEFCRNKIKYGKMHLQSLLCCKTMHPRHQVIEIAS